MVSGRNSGVLWDKSPPTLNWDGLNKPCYVTSAWGYHSCFANTWSAEQLETCVTSWLYVIFDTVVYVWLWRWCSISCTASFIHCLNSSTKIFIIHINNCLIIIHNFNTYNIKFCSSKMHFFIPTPEGIHER